ncbi:MAG: sigma-54 dependent transcriptional regulator [Candidatus Adiutrix sp.]|nr:sigma-54 dependent transcriptional regulator [Candidatus Adiutrix sp.]
MGKSELLGRVLVVDDEVGMRMMLSTFLKREGYQVDLAEDGLAAEKVLRQASFAAMITDLNMPSGDGMGLLAYVRENHPDLPVIVMSAYGSSDSALKAMHAGAFDYVFKPFQPDEVLFSLKKAEAQARLQRENAALRLAAGQRRDDGLIYKSRVMSELMSLARKMAETDNTVLITGESGSGKELVARAVHRASSRQKGPFVPVNCGAIQESLLESELFGHMRGSFTGASRDREGLFKAAVGGTLFLDEIGELPLSFQVTLLRAIQFSEIRPVGGEQSIKVDIRLVAATSRDLEELVRERRFREDLFYRLNVLPLHLPPLRERLEDLPLLASHFLSRGAARLGRPRPVVTPDFLEALGNYSWPGNIREMENLMDRLLVVADSEERLTIDDLPPYFKKNSPPPAVNSDDLDLKKAVKKLEAAYIQTALEQSSGNRSEAARLLGLSYPSLLSKIKIYGLDNSQLPPKNK